MKLEDLPPELREMVLACKTPQEVVALAKKVGRKLSDDELEAIAGGGGKWDTVQCPSCMGIDTEKRTSVVGTPFYVCLSCGHRWTYN